jgi:Spy/CpxP family protein refolding chaperone
MSKTKLLYGIIGLLILLNTSILVLVLAQPHPPRPDEQHRPDPKNVIISELQFDAAQQAAFATSMHKHHDQIEQLDERLLATRQQLYQLLATNQPDLAKKSEYMQQDLQIQAQIEETHWQHFQEIKQICRPDQLPKFAQLTTKFSQLFSKKGHPPHPPRHD